MRRKSIEINAFRHKNPIPAASRIDNIVMTGVITGRDAETGQLPATLEEQAAAVFRNVRETIETAGGTTDDILKMTVWLRNDGDRSALNSEWQKMFPDPGSRPA